jgi:hypothetical protein
MTRALLTMLMLSFCVPSLAGKVVLITMIGSGRVLQEPYRTYMTDDQNRWFWEKIVGGGAQVRIAPATESLLKC